MLLASAKNIHHDWSREVSIKRNVRANHWRMGGSLQASL